MSREHFCRPLAIIVMLSAPAAAWAQDDASCAQADLTSPGADRVVSYHDDGESGVSPGDVRVGRRTLVDGSGKTVGDLRWHNTPISPQADPEGTSFINKMYFVLAGGIIVTEAIIVPRSTMSDTEEVSTNDSELVVLGGTGEFRSASGVVIQTVGVDGDPKRLAYRFELRC